MRHKSTPELGPFGGGDAARPIACFPVDFLCVVLWCSHYRILVFSVLGCKHVRGKGVLLTGFSQSCEPGVPTGPDLLML